MKGLGVVRVVRDGYGVEEKEVEVVEVRSKEGMTPRRQCGRNG